MKYYRVKAWADKREVYTTSLNRKVSEHGYYSKLAKYELLTESQVRKCCMSGKCVGSMFELIDVDKNKVVTQNSGRRYYFG